MSDFDSGNSVNCVLLDVNLYETRCNYLPEAGSVAPPSSFWPMLTVQWFNIIRGDCQARSLLENVDLKKKIINFLPCLKVTV